MPVSQKFSSGKVLWENVVQTEIFFLYGIVGKFSLHGIKTPSSDMIYGTLSH